MADVFTKIPSCLHYTGVLGMCLRIPDGAKYRRRSFL